jgi:hypothetical protein
LTEGLGLTGAVIRVSEDTDRNEHRAAKTERGIVRVLACCEEIMEVKKRSLSGQNSVLDFIKSSSGSRVSPPVLLESGEGDPLDRSAVQGVVTPSSTAI